MAVRFSVALPAWNDAEWLPGAIESVLAQTFPDWELVIGDNASSDELSSIVQQYPDRRIRYERWATHVGASENHNRTIGLCHYEWVVVLSADDRYRPLCFEKVAARIEQVQRQTTRLAIAVTACRRLDPSGQLFEMEGDSQWRRRRGRVQTWMRHTPDGLYGPRQWLMINSLPGVSAWMVGSAAMSRDLLIESGAFRAEMGLSHDWELTMRLAAYGDVAYIDEPLFDYTERRGSLTSQLRSRP